MLKRRDLLKLGVMAGASAVAGGCVRPLDEPDLQIRIFQGGYGIDFYEQAARELEELEDVRLDLKGDPRIWEQLRPRFVGGDPPGLTMPGWGMDHYALIYEGQVMPLDDALASPPYGETSGDWKDDFLPAVLEMGQFRGKTYLLPYFLTLNGWWYNAGLFEENGWTPPRTYDELLSLGEKIQAKGIAPITYQGKYPYYAIQGFLLPWVIGIGGIEAFQKAEALEPGGWSSDAFVEAARRVVELRERGMFQKGADGMSHTEAQMEFLNGRAAMIPCGTWLETEMKEQTPAGFRMRFFTPPHVEGGKGDPTALQVGTEPWLIPTQARNQALAIRYLKYITTPKKAREFVLAKGTLSAIREANVDPLPDTLASAAEALRSAGVTWTPNYTRWYKELEEICRSEFASLLMGSSTPEQFAAKMEAAAQRLNRDPNVPKPLQMS
ncbi:MAG: extracellular solute-binding protein [Armatimonadota bacterium]